MLIIGIFLIIIPKSITNPNTVFKLNISTLNVYYIIVFGVILIILSAVISLLNNSLKNIFTKTTAKPQYYNHKNQ